MASSMAMEDLALSMRIPNLVEIQSGTHVEDKE